MKRVLILGSGMSSTSLINYLLEHAKDLDISVRVGDIAVESAREKIKNNPRAEAFFFNAEKTDQVSAEVKEADVVVSLLPVKSHPLIARQCVRFGKHLVTASYVSPEMAELNKTAFEKDVLLLNEMGVDPGIDHMSAMQVIDRLKEEGNRLIAFESATGGLVAPEYDDNPWRYKFTWAPFNVVTAGNRGARFLHNGKFKHIPYHKLFRRYETIDIPGYGEFEVYPNRDSLNYQETYGLKDLLTMFRGTIRRPGFCEAWDALVQLGATDHSYTMEGTENMTFREFTNSFLAYNIVDPVEQKVKTYLGLENKPIVMNKLEWLGLFTEEVIGIPELTPAQALQHILMKKWQMGPEDKDMIIMQHQFDYIRLASHHKTFSTMVVKGDDQVNTAMSKTVGLPLAIAVKLILSHKIGLRGVQIPVHKEIYEPVLRELESFGISFEEKDIRVS
ncbi:MAG: saccharopine dehydrogenase [Deltaproteobacteria bacterium]|nr:MAG: saccharopine dehydrogenase [Deltaproteobacteria bacterium]